MDFEIISQKNAMIGVEICVLRVAGSAGKGIFVIYRFLFTFLHYNV